MALKPENKKQLNRVYQIQKNIQHEHAGDSMFYFKQKSV